MTADKIRKIEAQPSYEETIPENVRASNTEKVKILLFFLERLIF